ncbi:ankyrin repeat-containing protein [Cucumis melo var. makuwa]|uniref:Ankyrin repeat-containing protein n=1 Tax=Cucumis melo var. makuwa TaxID=1194695 RepID=A0A5D3C7Z0_CUCMM|nr:ankyrin repeat-containing protein [Cucumis melo var. makuwa]
MGDPNQLNTPIECGKQLSLCEEGESVDPRIVAYLLIKIIKDKDKKAHKTTNTRIYNNVIHKKDDKVVKLWKRNLKYKGNWIQEVQGTMMLVATVIAPIAFQVGVNPPGGL